MKKTILLFVIIFAVTTAYSQKMITRTGEIKFEASMPAFEEIAATNNTVSCIFDLATGDFVTLALVKAFRFKIPLMEEHFNENYIESTIYPKATFKGKIIGFEASKLVSNKSNTFMIEGDLTLHGITKSVKNKITLTLQSGKINVASTFIVKNDDYKIKIPNLVKSKVAEDVKIILNFVLEEKK